MTSLQTLFNSVIFWSAWIIIPVIVEILPSIGCALLLIKRRIKDRRKVARPSVWPEITIILPVYNTGDTLGKCIDSIAEGTFPASNIYVLAANNGSSDNGFEVFATAQARHPELRMQWLNSEQGKSRALNLALYNSTSKYIINIDSDGALDPHALENLIAKFEANPKLNCMSGAIMVEPSLISNYKNPFSRLLRKLEFMEYAQAFLAGRSYASELNNVYTLSGAFSAFRKSAILSSQLYNTNTISEDTHITFQMRYLFGERIEMCDDALFFVEPIESVNKLYTQRQRWQRGSLEVARAFPISKLRVSRALTDVNVNTLLFDHTFAFPRLIWYIALICLMAMHTSVTTIAISMGILLALYVILGYVYFFSVLALLKMNHNLRSYYVRNWWVVALLPLFNLGMFFVRVAGIINSIKTEATWKTLTLSEEFTNFKTTIKKELGKVYDILRTPSRLFNCRAASQTTKTPLSADLPVASVALRPRRAIWYVGFSALLFLATTLLAVCYWSESRFNVSMNEIVATLTGPLNGTGGGTLESALVICLPVAGVALVALVLVCIALRRYDAHTIKLSRKPETSDAIDNDKSTFPSKKNPVKRMGCSRWMHQIFAGVCSIALVASLFVSNSSFGISDYIVQSQGTTNIYETLYVDPASVAITQSEETEKPRNIIYIYSESLEITYASKAEGGAQDTNYMPNLTELAHQNTSFTSSDTLSGSHALTNTNWTMAALFATSSGLPFSVPVSDSVIGEQDEYFSGVTTLGDILQEKGYNQEFLCGSDASFGGRESFFKKHGDYDIFDLYTAREHGYVDANYYHWWGIEDYILFDIAKDEVANLAAQDEPFNLTLLTVDPHTLDGYVCERCGSNYSTDTANVIACQDQLISEFVAWCQQQDFYDNTTIVITGDHPRMDSSLVSGVDYYDRAVYNCFINTAFDNAEGEGSKTNSSGATAAASVNEHRTFTPLDLFPTVLAALGYNIEGDKLGLGVNLFSTTQTLAEKYGFDWLDLEVSKSSDYYIATFIPEVAGLVDAATTSQDNTTE